LPILSENDAKQWTVHCKRVARGNEISFSKMELSQKKL
jgi:hypothetical protein